MEEQINNEYLRGFNSGYLMAEYEPELLSKILKSEINNPFIMGLKDGKATKDKEKVFSRLKDLNTLKQKKSRNRDIER